MGKLSNDIWQSPVLRRRFQQEAEFEALRRGKPQRPLYCIAVPDAETRRGNLVLQNYEDGIMVSDPHPAQCSLAAFLCDRLNRREHHDGLWVVGWTHPPSLTMSLQHQDEECWGRLVMIWLDEDGDPQFTVESDLDLVEMIEAGDEYYADLAAQGWAKWDEAYGKQAQKEDFGLKDHEIKREVLESLR